jgi:hypothetical protein
MHQAWGVDLISEQTITEQNAFELDTEIKPRPTVVPK